VDHTDLVACTLLGKMTRYHLYREAGCDPKPEQIWSADAESVAKVNALIVSDSWIAIGGIGKEGRGVIEIWSENEL
jgi:hypothetical protein